MLLVMKTLEDEWYIVIKAYKFTVFVLYCHILYIYCVSAISLQSTDSAILLEGLLCKSSLYFGYG